MDSKKIVGISEMIVTNNTEELLVTYSLGSCLGVTVYDSVAMVGGMIHCMLPLSSVDKNKAGIKPAMFVDTGIPLLFEKMYELGAQKDRILLKAAGCGQIMDPNNRFKIGERNFTILRKLLWKNGVLIKNQDTGGNISRTVTLEMSTGRTFIKSQGTEKEL